MSSGAIDTVTLHTNTGSTGYRIVKFKIFVNNPGVGRQESVIKIYKIPQTTADSVVDFSDQTLLAVAQVANNNVTTSGNIVSQYNIVFDNEIFNQDIYITHTDVDPSASLCNYYIELEQMPLDLNENTVATLKDIRNVA